MTQLIADVLKRDEEERLRRRNIEKQIRLGMLYYRGTPFYDAADVQADRMAAMRRNPFVAWMGSTPPGLDIVEFVMPGPAWDRGEYSAPTARYRAP